MVTLFIADLSDATFSLKMFDLYLGFIKSAVWKVYSHTQFLPNRLKNVPVTKSGISC